jgi:hypothetical protein
MTVEMGLSHDVDLEDPGTGEVRRHHLHESAASGLFGSAGQPLSRYAATREADTPGEIGLTARRFAR